MGKDKGQRKGLGNSDQWHMLNLTMYECIGGGVTGKCWVGDIGFFLFPECSEGLALSGSPVP